MDAQGNRKTARKLSVERLLGLTFGGGFGNVQKKPPAAHAVINIWIIECSSVLASKIEQEGDTSCSICFQPDKVPCLRG